MAARDMTLAWLEWECHYTVTATLNSVTHNNYTLSCGSVIGDQIIRRCGLTSDLVYSGGAGDVAVPLEPD